MHMGPRAATGIAHTADGLSSTYHIAFVFKALIEMCIARVDTVSMIDDDDSSEGAVFTGKGDDAIGGGEDEASTASPVHSDKTGRNDVCTCGSGKKYKKCCGA